MAHYAQVVDGKVKQVIVAPEDRSEFIDEHEKNTAGKWIQTSYNTRGGVHYDPETGEPDGKEPLRKNFAGKGYRYDEKRDAFIPPKPYESWKLNEETCLWEPPVPRPDDGELYNWNEEKQEWEEAE
jgi:hypothetical protein